MLLFNYINNVSPLIILLFNFKNKYINYISKHHTFVYKIKIYNILHSYPEEVLVNLRVINIFYILLKVVTVNIESNTMNVVFLTIF